MAYALAGRVDIDWDSEPIGKGNDGKDVYLKDIWPTQQEVATVIGKSLKQESYKRIYSQVFEGDDNWKALHVPKGDLYQWVPCSTYIANPPYFEGMTTTRPAVKEIKSRGCWRCWAIASPPTISHPPGRSRRIPPQARISESRR